MTPDLDQFLVFAAIGGAIGFFVQRFLRKKKGKAGCGSGDCCSSAPKLKPAGRR